MKLYGYFRSSAAYRVRIALNLKGLAVEHVPRHLRRGEQRSPDFLQRNPQGLVPVLELADGTALTQSLAIMEYLEEICPEPPLLPKEPVARARVRAFALAIACEVQPVHNLKVLNRLRSMGHAEEAVATWAHDTIAEGLVACEALVRGEVSGPYCFGNRPSLADIVLVPQLHVARRFGVDLTSCPRLLAAEAASLTIPAFAEAAPDRQADSE